MDLPYSIDNLLQTRGGYGYGLSFYTDRFLASYSFISVSSLVDMIEDFSFPFLSLRPKRVESRG